MVFIICRLEVVGVFKFFKVVLNFILFEGFIIKFLGYFLFFKKLKNINNNNSSND